MKDYRQKGIENNPTSPTPCPRPFKINNRGLFLSDQNNVLLKIKSSKNDIKGKTWSRATPVHSNVSCLLST